MLNKKLAKCLKLSCSVLASVAMMCGTAFITTLAASYEASVSSGKYGKLSVIVESKDETIPSNSKFSATFIEDDNLDFEASRFDDLFHKIDNSSKKKIEKLGIFEFNLKDAKGKEIQKFNKDVSVLIEVPKGFDNKDIEVFYIKDGTDEHFEKTIVNKNGKNYISFQANSLNPCVLIDKETKGTFYSILGASIVGVVITAGIIAYVMYKKKLNEKNV